MPDRDLLLELGTEEIPARFLDPAARQIVDQTRILLSEERIASASIAVHVTPCRIVLHVASIAKTAEDRTVEKSGPPWETAYGADGKPTAALTGFLKSAGARDAHIVKLQKKDRTFVGVRIREKGRPAAAILSEKLPGILAGLHFPKTMRWITARPDAFARPVRWICCLFHGRVLKLDVFGLGSSRRTFGNKFFYPKPFRPRGALDYFRRLEKQMVILSPEKRRRKILRESKGILTRRKFQAEMTEALVSEVIHLTEYPTVLLGNFDPAFLTIPDVILKSAMTSHQRYFPVLARGGRLAPHFLIVRNGPPDRKKLVARGNARVLTARFSDAKYFFETDLKKKLEDRIDSLKGVVHLEGLGSLHDRARRIRDLLVVLPPRIGVELDLERYADAAYLCKADLLTEVVREFPELQGVMGKIYAALEGKPADVADAIAEHYQPRGPQDPLPASTLGALLALADKFELILGCHSIGIKPASSADPYGLRRAAIGILRILLARGWHLKIGRLAEDAAHVFPSADSVRTQVPAVLDFFRGRLEAILKDSSPAEFVAACLYISDDPCEVAGKVEAFKRVSAESKEKYLTLLRTAKRAHNIVKNERNLPDLNPGSFQQDEERALHAAFKDWQSKVRALPERKYTDRLRAVLHMAAPLQTFFEKVFVMVDDVSLRANRLALIRAISEAFRSYAEFDKIAVAD